MVTLQIIVKIGLLFISIPGHTVEWYIRIRVRKNNAPYRPTKISRNFQFRKIETKCLYFLYTFDTLSTTSKRRINNAPYRSTKSLITFDFEN